MKLKQEVIERIKGRRAAKRMAETLNISPQYLGHLFAENKPGNLLTNYASLKFISKELDIPVEDLIEEQEEVATAQPA